MFNNTMKAGFSQNPMQGQKGGRMPMPPQQQGMQKPSKGGMPMPQERKPMKPMFNQRPR